MTKSKGYKRGSGIICVIVFKPIGSFFSKKEAKRAWQVNPDGAGYSITTPNGVLSEKGFMSFQSFWKAIRQYCKEDSESVFHFRITSTGVTCSDQTHPFKHDGESFTGKKIFKSPVFYMNGTIFEVDPYPDMNDTQTFLYLYHSCFSFKDLSLLSDFLEVSTGAKWLIHDTTGVYCSKSFKEHEGKYYSNVYHLPTYCSSNKSKKAKSSKAIDYDNFYFDESKNDWELVTGGWYCKD